MRRSLPVLLAAAALAAPAPACADDFIANLTRDSAVSAYGGAVAWSTYDEPSREYRLAIATRNGVPAIAPIPPSRRSFDVSLGPDSRNRTVALYTRCSSGESRCDIYRYDLSTRRERRLGFSSPREDEAWPVQWGGRVAFVRRHATGGSGEITACDVPFVKLLSSTAPSRRLDRGSCGRTTGMSLRRGRIIQVTFGSPASATRFDSQVRRLSVRGGAVTVLARQGSGEESNYFLSPSQSAASVWLTRTGVNPDPTYVRIDARSGAKREVRALASLTGALARGERGDFYYVEGGYYRGDSCVDAAPVPCRLVHTTVNPFSSAEQTLLPTLTIDAPSDHRPVPKFGDPFALSGRLYRSVVSAGKIVRREPIAGSPIELLRRVTDTTQPGLGEAFVPTGVTVMTGADGRWSYDLPVPTRSPWFSAVTRGADLPPTYAGRGTVGAVEARITLTVSGTTFAGTVAPGQPGRTIRIQRLTARKCFAEPSGAKTCIDRWTTVADAPLDGGGTEFSTIVPAPQPGTYRAAILYEDTDRDPGAYPGASPDTPAG